MELGADFHVTYFNSTEIALIVFSIEIKERKSYYRIQSTFQSIKFHLDIKRKFVLTSDIYQIDGKLI
jgi:hypothetical protein